MSDLRNHPPIDLLEMFERREGDVRPAMPMPPSVRRRVRTRRGVAAAAIVALGALLIGVAIKTLPTAFDSRPADEPKPPAVRLFPTASGHTELFRWQVLAGPGDDGRLDTQLQISSLAGGDWTTVEERSFDPTGSAFSSTYLEEGQFLDGSPSTTLVWGFLPDGADRVVLEPGPECATITFDASDTTIVKGGRGAIWATRVRCGGPGTIVARGAGGAEIATNGYTQPIPADVWGITTSRHGGVGWVLHRILDQPTGIGIGDGGVPDDIRSPIRADQLSSASVAWGMTPPADDGRFVYGIAVRDIDHVILMLPDGSTVKAILTTLPDDTFDVFYADVSQTPMQLTAFDARCNVLVNESMNGGPVGPPAGGCEPSG